MPRASAARLGADIVKCWYTGDISSMRLVTAACPVPVVIAGGPRCDTDVAVLQMVEDAMTASAPAYRWAATLQHRRPDLMARGGAAAIIIEGAAVREAKEILGSSPETAFGLMAAAEASR